MNMLNDNCILDVRFLWCVRIFDRPFFPEEEAAGGRNRLLLIKDIQCSHNYTHFVLYNRDMYYFRAFTVSPTSTQIPRPPSPLETRSPLLCPVLRPRRTTLHYGVVWVSQKRRRVVRSHAVKISQCLASDGDTAAARQNSPTTVSQSVAYSLTHSLTHCKAVRQSVARLPVAGVTDHPTKQR